MRNARSLLSAAAVAAAALAGAGPAFAQATHAHAGGALHAHAGGPIDCTTLTSPPWTGLPELDRERMRALEATVASLGTTEAARAAGYRPALGNIPTMGVHWVHPGRSRDGVVELGEPDHLMFAPIDGEERLVGAAYAFTAPPGVARPSPFESELAAWHDHPEFAGPGETLHMLHVWFVPSPNGPFAGSNFWLPFHGAGITPPSACWTADEAGARRIRDVAMALAVTQLADETASLGRARGRRNGRGPWQLPPFPGLPERSAQLDAAARAGDRDAWNAAADRLLAEQPASHRLAAGLLLDRLTRAQAPSGSGAAGSGAVDSGAAGSGAGDPGAGDPGAADPGAADDAHDRH